MIAAVTSGHHVFDVGAACFGGVIGWITHRTLRRTATSSVSDIASVVGAVGGGAVLGIFKDGDSFGWYAIGLAGGFLLYLIVALCIDARETVTWMGGKDPPETGRNVRPDRE